MSHQAGSATEGAGSGADGTAGLGTPATPATDAAPSRADSAPVEADAEAGGPAEAEVTAPASPPARPDTGEPRVDAALTLLDRLTELPVTEHAAVFEQVHAELTAVLGQLDPESAGADG